MNRLLLTPLPLGNLVRLLIVLLCLILNTILWRRRRCFVKYSEYFFKFFFLFVHLISPHSISFRRNPFHKEKAAAEVPLPPSLNGQLSVISQIFSFYRKRQLQQLPSRKQRGLQSKDHHTVIASLRRLNIIRRLIGIVRLDGIVRLGGIVRIDCFLTFFDSLNCYCRATGRIKGYGIVFISLLWQFLPLTKRNKA